MCLARVDPRQRALFGAAFLLGYAAACARGGLDAMTFGAPTGPFGLIYRRADYAQPYFDTLGGRAVYPAFHVLAGLTSGSGRPLLRVIVSRPGAVEALAWRENGRDVVWLANLTASPVEVALEGTPAGTARMAVLDTESFVEATRDPDALDADAAVVPAGPFRLDGYAVARIARPSA